MEFTILYIYIPKSEDVDQLIREIHHNKPDFVLMDKDFSELGNISEVVNTIETKIQSLIRDNNTKRISDVLMKEPEEIVVIQGPDDEGQGLIRLAIEVLIKKVNFHSKEGKSLRVIICTHLEKNDRIFKFLLSLLPDEDVVKFEPSFALGFTQFSTDRKNIFMITGPLKDYAKGNWTIHKEKCSQLHLDTDWVFCLNDDAAANFNDQEDYNWFDKMKRMYNALVYCISSRLNG